MEFIIHAHPEHTPSAFVYLAYRLCSLCLGPSPLSVPLNHFLEW